METMTQEQGRSSHKLNNVLALANTLLVYHLNAQWFLPKNSAHSCTLLPSSDNGTNNL